MGYYETTLGRLWTAGGDLQWALESYRMSVGKTDIKLKESLEKAEGQELSLFSDFTGLASKVTDLTVEQIEAAFKFQQNFPIEQALKHPVFCDAHWCPEIPQAVVEAFSYVLCAVVWFRDQQNETVALAVQRVLSCAWYNLGILMALGDEKSDGRSKIGSLPKRGSPGKDYYLTAARQYLVENKRGPDQPKITKEKIAEHIVSHMKKQGMKCPHTVVTIRSHYLKDLKT